MNSSRSRFSAAGGGLALATALLFALLGVASPQPAQAALGDLLLDACIASESNLTGVIGCEDITATTTAARGFQNVLASADGASVYGIVSGTVLHFSRTAAGDLGFSSCVTSFNSVPGCTDISDTIDALRGARGGAISPDGRHLYVTSFLEDAVSQLAVRADGSLEFVECWSSKGTLNGCVDISSLTATMDNATSVTVTPDGNSVYVGDSSDSGGSVVHFERAADGALAFVGCLSSSPILGCTDLGPATSAVTGIARILVSPDSRYVYAGTDGSDGLLHFTRNLADGSLILSSCATSDPAQSGCTLLPTNALEDVNHEAVAMSPDGAHIYVAGRPRNAIARFTRDAATGGLTYVDCLWISGATTGCAPAGGASGGFRTIESLAVSPDGLSLYAAAFGQDSVLQLDRDPQSGALSRPRCISSAGSADNGCSKVFEEGSLLRVMSVVVSPDSRDVYAGSNQALVHLERETNECFADETTLCLNQGRFEVKITWRDFQSEVGRGSVVPFGTNDSGIMWFFQSSNWEQLIKVLDGCAFNGNFWVFAASVTDVEYTIQVRDVVTGERREYFNPLGNPSAAITDTEAFAGCPEAGSAPGAVAGNYGSSAPVRISLDRLAGHPAIVESSPAGTPFADLIHESAAGTQVCTPSDAVMCLNGGRFQVELQWRDFADVSGPGLVAPFGSNDSGLYYFFSASNLEMLVKVLDGCSLTGHFWVFAAATTNVEYTLTVTDTETGQRVEYFNPLGTSAAAITDTQALATCPGN